MRSLKNLIGRKKPLIDINTGVIDLRSPGNISVDYFIGNNDFILPTPNNNGRIYNQINYDNTTLIGNGIVLSNLPTSPIGLVAGSVWRDVNNTLRIV
jgi:hypothetical protein